MSNIFYININRLSTFTWRVKLIYLLLLFTFSIASHSSFAQKGTITGTVKSRLTGQPLPGTEIVLQNTLQSDTTDQNGKYSFDNLNLGSYTLLVNSLDLKFASKTIHLGNENVEVDFDVDSSNQVLKEVVIQGGRVKSFGIARLKSVEGTAIYEAKKTEVIILKDINANLAANTPRQVFSKVAGLNVWESDAGGLQLGIAARGLNPNRSTDFNIRQNGYDISPDALGYPEAYYTPPMEALERIEVVRGAASLQYGTQFGGLINFIFKQGPTNKKLEFTSRQTGGSFGFFNSFNSLGGTVGKLNYYTYYQYKRSDGWRENSQFDQHNAYGSLTYHFTPKLSATFQYTFMEYLAKQPGGLTDLEFKRNARASTRHRNWFVVNWNLLAFSLDYIISDQTKINIRNFALVAKRGAVGFLKPLTRPDDLKERDVLMDNYRNFGSETRLIHNYKLVNGNQSTFLIGARFYRGVTYRQQGIGTADDRPNFNLTQNENSFYSDHAFPNYNYSLFVENIFRISPSFSVTPGMRWEFIKTISEGYYQNEVSRIGNFPVYNIAVDNNTSTRNFPFFGIGASYKPSENFELYSNASQNYKAINFNDLRVNNASLVVDPNLKDERGYNIDLGVRGNNNNYFNYDVSLFYLAYNSRISTVLGVKPDSITIYRFRTNIANSKAFGIETFAELNLWRLLFSESTKNTLSIFSNITLLDARYYSSLKFFRGKKVELVPSVLIKGGLTYRNRNFSATCLFSYTGEQFSDASNVATIVPSAIEGLIPAYHIVDINATYTFNKHFSIAAGINNLTNNIYFTRRAVGYPGPGIIPSDPRNVYGTIIFKL